MAAAQLQNAAAEAVEAGDDAGRGSSVFAPYHSTLKIGKPHPGEVSESVLLASVSLPPLTYPPDGLTAWGDLVSAGRLSQLQLESVLHAGQRHQTILPSGRRAGFFIGDGAGIGKGRQIGGVIMDNCARGRLKHVWFSISPDLRGVAEGDLDNLGCGLVVIDGCNALGKASTPEHGVLFSTYTTPAGSTSQLEKIIAWCGDGFDGCLVFDEAHCAKNADPNNPEKSSGVNRAVMALQERLPMARVVYSSATGVTELTDLQYATRLTLWGPGTSFNGFEDFYKFMEPRGIAGMELLAMEMKASGAYVARGLSWTDATFETVVAPLSDSLQHAYDQAAGFLKTLRRAVEEAGAKVGVNAMNSYWSMHLRFCKELMVAAKVESVVKLARKARDKEGKAVVIALQTTGAAGADRAAKKQQKAGETACEFDAIPSTAHETLLYFIEKDFPTECSADPTKNPVESPSCVKLRDEMRRQAMALPPLPPAALDALIDDLGGVDAVAELSGRTHRIVEVADKALSEGAPTKYRREQRPLPPRKKRSRDEMEKEVEKQKSRNEIEMEAFMNGIKKVALITDAASTGISLHASHRCPQEGQRQRVHLSIQLPWSADKTVQMMGRSHRSNQVSAPNYSLVTTDLGGETRFLSSVARRLEQLGAVARGHRQAAIGGDWSGVNLIESAYGEVALKFLGVEAKEYVKANGVYGHTVRDEDKESLVDVGLHRGSCDVPTFLNRLLGLTMDQQNYVLARFTSELERLVNKAKTNGSYDEGVVDLQTGPIEQSQILRNDSATGAPTTAYTLTHVSVTADDERLVVIVGPVLPVWDSLTKVVDDARALRVVRVATDDGQRIAGVRFPPDRLSALRDELEQVAQRTQTAAVEVQDVMEVVLRSIRDEVMTKEMRKLATAGGASAASSASASSAASVGAVEPRGAAAKRNEG